ncbi:MAG: thiamine phosphate synthase [Arcticibacter sp.]
MLILISSPSKVAEEAILINRLFDEGLDLFHLRRPQGSEQDTRALIEKIHNQHLKKVSIHQHHHVATDYGINRIHYNEQERITLSHETLHSMSSRGYELSTSVHSIQGLELLSNVFSYALIGPVFDSISKPGYTAQIDLSKRSSHQRVKAVAIGGINASNIHQLKESFDGAAVLGSIWSSTTPIYQFRQIRRIWNTKDQ